MKNLLYSFSMLALIIILGSGLQGCASGATTSIGGYGGSYGSGGGVGISFPVGGESNSSDPRPQSRSGARYVNGAENDYANLGSNLFTPYPKHNCYEPMKPDSGDSSAMYMAYKQKLDKYRICIDTYAQNAKNDMMDIENKANSALRQYRNFVTMP